MQGWRLKTCLVSTRRERDRKGRDGWECVRLLISDNWICVWLVCVQNSAHSIHLGTFLRRESMKEKKENVVGGARVLQRQTRQSQKPKGRI